MQASSLLRRWALLLPAVLLLLRAPSLAAQPVSRFTQQWSLTSSQQLTAAPFGTARLCLSLATVTDRG